jgi:signal transduction histidine kinase/DNA-binding response OmpR family regulator
MLAFLAISFIAIAAAALGMWSLARVESSLRVVTDIRIPETLTLTDVARQTQQVLRAAPALLIVSNEDQRLETSASVLEEANQLDRLISQVNAVEPRVFFQSFYANLLTLDALVQRRLATTNQREDVNSQLIKAADVATRLVSPAERILGGQLSEWRTSNAFDADQLSRRQVELSQSIIGILPQIDLLTKIGDLKSALQRISEATSEEEIDVLAFGLQRAILDVESVANAVPDRARVRLLRQVDILKDLSTGNEGLPTLRKQELSLIRDAERALEINASLSIELSESVNRLVASAKAEIEMAKSDATTVTDRNTLILQGMGAASVIVSVLVGWLYVSRNLLRRITGMSDSMTAIAAGNLNVPLPPTTYTDEIGQMATALKVFRDTAIEVQRSNLFEVQTARQRLQEAIGSLSQGFALFDQNGGLLICNARYREIMLADARPIKEGTAFEWIAATAAASGRFVASKSDPEAWRQSLLSKFFSGADTSNEQFDTDQWAQVTIRDAKEVGTVVVLSDITEVKRISEELLLAKDAAEAANEAKSTFLASMSHEVRTPLNGIMGMSTLLKGTTLDPEQRDFASTINEAAEALLTIINDILDFSKVEAGAMELENTPIDLVETVESAVDLLAPKARERGIVLACRLSTQVPPAILGDSVRLKQILLNLLNNAIKFTDEGEVEVAVDTLAPQDGARWLQITVRDTGIGIPEDRMDRLFKSFSQVDTSTTRRFGGTGLGLVITQRLIGLMGGTIEVTSTPNVGSVFTLKLPYQTATLPVSRPVEDMLALIRHCRILIVDDNQTNLTILAERLLGWDLTPEVADHPDKAVALLRAGHSFDAIITDFKMPGRTGLHMALDMRQEFGDQTPPMILYSSVSLLDPAMRARFESAGFKSHLMKPAKTPQLLDALIKALRPEAEIPTRLAALSQFDWSLPDPARDPLLEPVSGTDDSLEILLVDDNAINRKIGTKILRRLGFEAIVVESGAEALSACRGQAFDVIFMDIEMPDMDGVTATAKLREDLGDKPHPYIVALTANAMVSDRESYLQSGMDDYLSKPIDIQKLTECLHRAQNHARSGASDPAKDAKTDMGHA